LKAEALENAYIIGGNGVLSNKAVEEINKITSKNISSNRLGGSDRYETNAKVIQKFYQGAFDKAYITIGLPLADSLGAGVVAALNKSPVILTANDLSTTQKQVLKSNSANKIVQVGGTVSSKSIQSAKDSLSSTQK